MLADSKDHYYLEINQNLQGMGRVAQAVGTSLLARGAELDSPATAG
jgi:WD40 repeat protein